jgi:hypothetical protein
VNGRQRKVALIGGVKETLLHTPWDDPSWEIWAHNSLPPRVTAGRRVDRYFDLHPPHCFQVERKCGRANYYGWLKSLTTPIYMQQKYPEIPASVRYPRERMQAEWPLIPFGSQTAWMIALALSEGVTHIGLYGIHYTGEPEREEQHSNAQLWAGIALGRGVHLVIPDKCPIARTPKDLYGYESHTPEKYAKRIAQWDAWRSAQVKTDVPGLTAAIKGFDPSKLRRAQDDEIPQPPPEVLAAWANAEGAPV